MNKTTVSLTINGKVYNVLFRERDSYRRGSLERGRFHRIFHSFDAIPFPEEARPGGPNNPAYKKYKKDYTVAMRPFFDAIGRVLGLREGAEWKYNAKSGCTMCSCSPAYETFKPEGSMALDIEIAPA